MYISIDLTFCHAHYYSHKLPKADKPTLWKNIFIFFRFMDYLTHFYRYTKSILATPLLTHFVSFYTQSISQRKYMKFWFALALAE